MNAAGLPWWVDILGWSLVHLHWQGALGCGLVALLNPARFAQGLAACDAPAPAM